MGIKIFVVVAAIGLILACPAAVVAERSILSQPTNPTNIIPITGSSAFDACSGPVISTINADYEESVIVQTNQVRMQAGLPPLKHVTQLDESARNHAADMAQADYFDHNTYKRDSGQLVETCDTWARIQKYYDNWLALGENIAAGQNSPAMAMDGWMHSPEHKKNILNPNYWEIGVGYYKGSGMYHEYWDQNFGRRDGVYPIVINGEEAKTTSTNVNIYAYGEWSEIRLKSDGGSWGPWLKFQNSFSWQIPDIPGTHTVTAEMRSSDTSTTSSDTIDLVK